MKVMAIARPKAPLTPEQIKEHLPGEVPATLKLYLEGKIDQFWYRAQGGPIFLMNAETAEQAQAALDTLPLVRAKLFEYELIPVGPLLPLGRLLPGA